MTEGEKAVRLVFPGFKFGLEDPAEAEGLVDLGVGGFCLYGGRIEEIAEFTARLQQRARAPLLFCADYEDGVHSQCAGATPLPSNMGLGASGSEALAYQKGAITAVESAALGVRWVLAPVCDLATLPSNPIVNVRSFSSDPGTVTRMARAYLKGLKSERVLSCLKHFPGHGETRQDSHLELPLVRASRALLFRRELVPFRSLAPEADAVMTGHLRVPALEKGPKLPYSLSADVKKTLRRGMGFEGLVVTDALNMQAIGKYHEEGKAAQRALLGGSDILLVPHNPRELIRGLIAAVEGNAELRAAVAASIERLERAGKACLPREAPAARLTNELDLVGSRKHREVAARMAESCLAWSEEPAVMAPGTRFRYWEPEAASSDEWLGRAFAEELRAAGASLEDRVAAGEILVMGSFLSPRAYTGRIEYDPEELRRIRVELSRAQKAVVVSFGSPFVFEALQAQGLCAFSKNEAAQRAAARALMGRIEVKGRMPVALRLS